MGPRIEGGDPPDVAIFPQPGVVQSFAEQGDLIELEDIAGDEVDANYGKGAREAGSVDGTLYGVWFRAAQKSTVWYNVDVFEGAGVEPPTTSRSCSRSPRRSRTTASSRTRSAPTSAGRSPTCSRTSTCGPRAPRCTTSSPPTRSPWTDQSVKDALTVMAEIVGDESLLAGGAAGAEQTDFNGSVTQVFADPPKGAIIFEGDFVGGVISGETKAEVGTDADFFEFPSIDGSEPAVLGGGDFAVLLADTEGGKALIEYLATPEAAEIWVAEGGFISPNTEVDTSTYPDEVSQRAAQALVDAGESVRYDLSDLQPTEFGATTGQGIWGILIDFLRDPSDVDGTAAGARVGREEGVRRVVDHETTAPSGGSGRGRSALFLAPALVLLGAIVVYPIFFSVGRSLFDASGARVRRRRELPGDVHVAGHAHGDQEQPDLGRVRAEHRDRPRPRLRGAHRAHRVEHRVQGGHLHADGDLLPVGRASPGG